MVIMDEIINVGINITTNYIKIEDILKIAQGTSDENLPIHFSMYLDIDGHLRVDVRCEVTGKTLRITVSDKEFVKYE